MSFELQPSYKTRLFYEPGGTSVYKLPKGNIITALDLLVKLQVDIASGGASNAPDFQVFNAIERFTLIRDSDTSVWNMSGQALAAYFTYKRKNGVSAGSNTAIAGSAASDVKGQHFLNCPAYPFDAPNPKDFAIDTRFADYEIHIKWRDLGDAGTLFGTLTGAITAVNSENYIDIELKVLKLKPNPIDGRPDALTDVAPLVMGLREERIEITQNNSQFELDLTDGQEYRNALLYTTHVANTKQEVGENDILQGKITLRDTQNKVIQSRRAEMVRESTSIEWGMGSNLPNGLYDLNITQFGNITDVVKSTPVRDLRIESDVVKQSNATYMRPIYVTQQRQI